MAIKKALKSLLPRAVFRSVEPYGHLGEAMLLNAKSGFPARGLNIIGITGTNGKTTTSFLVHRMLHEAGYKVGLLSTVAYGVGEDIHPQIAHMTTVSVPLLLKRLKDMKNLGAEWIVLETTSHALAQHRVWGIPYSVAVFTNLTHEHLDYHGTFERYREAKVKLFRQADKNKQGLRIGIINAEDENADYFAKAIKYPITYGVETGDILATELQLTSGGSSYTARVPKLVGRPMNAEPDTSGSDDEYDEYRIVCNIPGSFNVHNSLAAVGVGRALGLSKEQIEQGIAALKRVEGRMDPVNEGQNFDVIVDFAHTPDSFEKLFKDLKPVVKGRLIVLFGSAGRRDETKRAIQGKLAGEYADIVVVTEEDDRDIDGVGIMEQIAGGAEAAGKVRNQNLYLIHDRTEAIRYAIGQATSGDTVLLLGKGHEKTIERADGEHPWDEIGTVRAAILERAKL